MMSIEDRLARDAVQARLTDQPAPSLDLLLDNAIATAPRRRPQVWLAVAAALVVAAGVAAFVTVRLNRDSTEPTAGITLPTPHSIVRDGTRFTVGESSPIGLVGDPSDPRVLDVYLLDVYDQHDPNCSRISPSARLVDESASSVRLVVFDYATAPIEQQADCAYAGSQSTARLIRVRLREPLGSRSVLDVRTGKPLAVLSRGQAPAPSYVPAGYRSTDVQNFNPPHNFAALRSYSNGKAIFYLEFTEASAVGPLGSITGHVTVHGMPGLVTERSPLRCLMWADQNGLESQVCSYGKSGALPVAELLRIADSLPH
jgi:hypothetical protein